MGILTVLLGPMSYGMPLLLLVPILAALLANLFVGRGPFLKVVVASTVGPVLVVCVVWLLRRVDDYPVEGIVAAFSVTACVIAILRLRRVTSKSRRWTALGERLLQDRRA